MRTMLHPYHPRQPIARARKVHSSARRSGSSPRIGLFSRAARQISLTRACWETLPVGRSNFDANRVKLDLLGGVGRFVADGVAVAYVLRDLLKHAPDRVDVARLERDSAAGTGELAQALGIGVLANRIGDGDGVDDDVRRLRLFQDG